MSAPDDEIKAMVESFCNEIARRAYDAMPEALDQANRIAIMMNEHNLPPSFTNTLALLLIACGNARNMRPRPETPQLIELLVTLVWALLERDMIGHVRPPSPKEPKS